MRAQNTIPAHKYGEYGDALYGIRQGVDVIILTLSKNKEDLK